MAAGHGPSVGREGAGGIRDGSRGRAGRPQEDPRTPPPYGSPRPVPVPLPRTRQGPHALRIRARRTYEGEPPCSCCCRPPKERPPRGAGPV
ncbi:hypothetical protein SSIG_07279 [Streptomyces filamentosus NRRL 11379]|nr:hypothetical protein SSIG_07279 [Streptomyces filamentosus NRRL 11379]